MNLPASVRSSTLAQDYPVLEIHHPLCSGRVALHGAHVLDWAPTGQAPVLYLSPTAVYKAGKAVRGGIPICWPWFNAHPTNPALPAHGLVRGRFWELHHADENASGVSLTFALGSSDETRKQWDADFEALLHVHMGSTLRLGLTARNTGSAAWNMTGALHTYFTVGNIADVTITGLEDADYLDTVGGRTPRHQTGAIQIGQEVDRIYRSTATVEIEDRKLGRVIRVEKGGSGSTVVWNPWIDKAKAIGDMPDEDYLGFVCVETANAWEDVITVAPGSEHELWTRISAEPASE